MRKQEIVKDFDYYIDEYLYYCNSRRLSPKTMNSYEQTLRLFERWAREQEQIASPNQVREQTIRRYIYDLQVRGKYSFYANEEREATNYPTHRRDYREQISATTVNNYIRNLRAFFNWYVDCENRAYNPMQKIRQLENERKPKEYLDDSELHKLFQSFDKSYFSDFRDLTVITLILDTGMRLGECLMLTDQCINVMERTITIPAEAAKGRKTRSVFFSIKTARLVQQWLRFRDRYVDTSNLFPVKATGLPVEIRTFEKHFRQYIARAGITKEVSPHALRNNFAKRCIMAGMDIYTLSRILGHSSVTVTEQAYLDLTDKDIQRCYQKYSPVENLK